MNFCFSENPFVLDETADFAVVYKPPRMHSLPGKGCGGTLLGWYAVLFPPVMDISGRREGGGLLHRLDFETHGLALLAKNQKSFDFLLTQQDQGNFTKEYSAVCHKRLSPPSSFPDPPAFPLSENPWQKLAIESFFRPFGPGRKQVRPVSSSGKIRKKLHVAKNRGGFYRTEIVNCAENGHYAFTVRLIRGFRHQIRCHLAWVSCPIVNDQTYSELPAEGCLALRSHGLFFADPQTGKPREYRIDPLPECSKHA